MAKIIAGITMSVDGYITGPNDGPGKGLGDDGERLHHWVFGGPWTYENEPRGEPTGEDAEYLDAMTARVGAIIIGRHMYEAAEHWGDKNPFGVPVFVVTHRPEEQPETGEFGFVGSLEEAVDRAKEAAGDKDVSIGAAPTSSDKGSPPASSTSSASSSRPSSSEAASACSRASRRRSIWSTGACGSPSTRRSSSTW